MTFSPDRSPGPISPNKAIEPAAATPTSPKGFSAHMEGARSSLPQTGSTNNAPTPMEVAKGASPQTTNPSFDTMLAQTKGAQDTLGEVEKQLQTPNLSLKRSQAHLLKNKLVNAQQYIRQTGATLGVPQGPLQSPSGNSPLARFIAYVNDGQDQLVQVQKKLKTMAAQGQQISAAEMLSVTVKMNLAQQEIEYSSTLLGKIVDSFKQLMNIQL